MTKWEPAPEHPVLEEHALHVWRVDMNTPDPDTAISLALLDDNEQERTARFTSEGPKRHFVLMRSALRNILSRYTKISPKDLFLEFNEHGKPSLCSGELFFNLSHSGDLGLIAVTKCGDVGVDIEYVKNARATDEIAKRFFSPSEISAMNQCSGDEKVRVFFRCWSRKEAVIKALGEGLSCPLSSFDVSLEPDQAALLDFRRDDVELNRWNMFALDAGPEYAAAAAVIGKCEDITGYTFSGDMLP